MSHTVITTDNFESKVLQAKQPVLVDFWAVWCGPCKVLEPIVDQIAEEYAGKVTVGKVNVDEHPTISQQFQVLSIPTLLLFKDGQPVETLIGVHSKADIAAKLDAHL